MGDLKGTLETLIIANPERPDFCLIYRVDKEEFVFDTAVIREAVGGLPLNERRSSRGSASISPRASARWSRAGRKMKTTRTPLSLRRAHEVIILEVLFT